MSGAPSSWAALGKGARLAKPERSCDFTLPITVDRLDKSRVHVRCQTDGRMCRPERSRPRAACRLAPIEYRPGDSLVHWIPVAEFKQNTTTCFCFIWILLPKAVCPLFVKGTTTRLTRYRWYRHQTLCLCLLARLCRLNGIRANRLTM